MKKFCMALVLFVVGIASAQMNFGAKAAFNTSNFYGDDVPSGMEWCFGFNAGAAGKIKLLDVLYLVPELAVDLRRSFYSEQGVDLTLTTWALDIPALLRFYPAAQAFFFEFGPTFDFILDRKGKVEAGGQSATLDGDTDPFEFGLALGFGYSFLPALDANFRYALGLNSVSSGDLKNMQLQFGIAYWFI